MKYTFQTEDCVDFVCSKCFHRNELTFKTKISGKANEAIPPRICVPYSHASNVRCGKCGGKMFAVDHSIGKFIQKLNLMEYPTKSCCGGHIEVMPMNPQVVGVHIKPDEKMIKYSSREHDYIAEHRRAKTSIDIEDIKGLPECSDIMDEPFVWFRHDIGDITKRFLLFSVKNVIKNYNSFAVKVYPSNKHGVLLNRNEINLDESEFSMIIIEANKEFIKKYIEENNAFPDLTKEFKNLLGDLIIELDKISKIDHGEAFDE